MKLRTEQSGTQAVAEASGGWQETSMQDSGAAKLAASAGGSYTTPVQGFTHSESDSRGSQRHSSQGTKKGTTEVNKADRGYL